MLNKINNELFNRRTGRTGEKCPVRPQFANFLPIATRIYRHGELGELDFRQNLHMYACARMYVYLGKNPVRPVRQTQFLNNDADLRANWPKIAQFAPVRPVRQPLFAPATSNTPQLKNTSRPGMETGWTFSTSWAGFSRPSDQHQNERGNFSMLAPSLEPTSHRAPIRCNRCQMILKTSEKGSCRPCSQKSNGGQPDAIAGVTASLAEKDLEIARLRIEIEAWKTRFEQIVRVYRQFEILLGQNR